jgi:hypothetical protein
LNYTGRNESQARTPSPIRNIQQEKMLKSISYHIPSSSSEPRPEPPRLEPPREQRRIQIQTSTSGGVKQARALKAMQPPSDNPETQSLQRKHNEETESEYPELRYLEAQQKELQRQQLLELQRFKQQKADIIKLNNRKKEIELMRSIEAEKNKLRKIHAKQQELNEIYKTVVEKESSSNQQDNIHSNIHSKINSNMKGGCSTTMKRLVVNDYDVDAKRTKKNLTTVVSNKFIEPTDTAHIKSGKLGSKLKSSNVVDKIVLEKPIKQDEDVVEVVQFAKGTQQGGNKQETLETVANVEIVAKDSSDNMDNKDNKDNQDNKDKIKESSKKESSKTKIKKELVPGEPLKYYTRKDKQYVSWPSKAELYDVSKFEDTLDIFLGIEPFFNRKQEKIKATMEKINKELKEEYGFRKLSNFKPTLLDVIYKIIVGDKIKFTFE